MIKITKLKPYMKDERGLAFDFGVRDSNHIVALYRKKGSVSGLHYHKGESVSKSPEIFYVAKGKLKIIAKDVNTQKQETYIVQVHTVLEVPPMIYHEFHALTDIVLIEFNCEKDHFKDTAKVLPNNS